MAAPTSQNEVTARKLSDTISGLWGKIKDTFQTKLTGQTAYSAKGSATKVPQITTNSLGQVTSISEVAISGVTPASHTHGNIQNGGTLNDTAAAAAGNDYVVIRDADNNKIQTSTIKGTDVADAVSKKHSHSTLTLSTTAQAYDGSHTLVLPSSDPYTSARTPSSHASTGTGYGAGTTSNYGHVKLATGDMNGATHADGVAVSKNHTHSQYASSSHNHSAADITSGTLGLARGGTGATDRLGALKTLTNENVGTSATYFLTISDNWGKGGYSSVANVKSVLGLGSAAYTDSSAYQSPLPTSGTATGTYYINIAGNAATANNAAPGSTLSSTINNIGQTLSGVSSAVSSMDTILTNVLPKVTCIKSGQSTLSNGGHLDLTLQVIDSTGAVINLFVLTVKMTAGTNVLVPTIHIQGHNTNNNTYKMRSVVNSTSKPSSTGTVATAMDYVGSERTVDKNTQQKIDMPVINFDATSSSTNNQMQYSSGNVALTSSGGNRLVHFDLAMLRLSSWQSVFVYLTAYVNAT